MSDAALQKIQIHLVKKVTAVATVVDKLNNFKGEITSEKI